MQFKRFKTDFGMEINELVARCKNGDGQAMSLLYTRCMPVLTKVCRRYVSNGDDVQDIVHDAFIVMMLQLHTLRDASRIDAWMTTIVKNLALKHLQLPVGESLDETENLDTFENVENVENIDSAAYSAPSIPDIEELMAMVEQLPSGYRSVFKLAVLDGLSHREIAQLLHIEPHTSSSQLSRAKKMLQRMLKRHGYVPLLLAAFVAPLLYWLLPSKKEDAQG